MFVGAVPQQMLAYMQTRCEFFANRAVVIGCSGSFGVEKALLNAARKPESVYSNDVSLYSCVLGSWMARKPFRAAPNAKAPEWLRAAWGEDKRAVACLHVMLDALEFSKQNNEHRKRMWDAYGRQFAQLVEKTEKQLDGWPRVIDFYAGDVRQHFEQHANDRAIFMCYAPTYRGGYERMYRSLHEMFDWDEPSYELLDDARRDDLLKWMMDGREYVWFDDRVISGTNPILGYEQGRMHTAYLYANCIERAGWISPTPKRKILNLPLANEKTVLTEEMDVILESIKTSDLAVYKDMYLSKKIAHSAGGWAFTLAVGGQVVGFLEVGGYSTVGSPKLTYLNSDFVVPGTPYERLSKLIVMAALSTDFREAVERVKEIRQVDVRTTAFTDRPVSMKYRGVLELENRGEKNGQKFLNYRGSFTGWSLQETYRTWLKKYGSVMR